jgi:hypothetical protein
MTETGGTSRREPYVRPSKFGAGYTVGGPDVSPQPVAPAPAASAAAEPIGPGVVATGTEEQSAVALDSRREPDAGLEPVNSGPRNALATASLVLVVLLGAFLSPITLIMAYAARAQIKRTGERGADVALAALVVSWVFLVVGLVVVALKFGVS